MECIAVEPNRDIQVDHVVERLLALLSQGQIELPILPEAAQRIVALSQDDSASVRDIVEVLKRDQSLTSYVLKVANSPICTPTSPIVSVHQACTRLGARQIRDLALMVTISSRTFVVRGHERLLNDMFKHAVVTAYFAQEIARRKRLNVEETFLFGLLHDIGRPAVLALVAKEPGLSRAELVSAIDRVHVRFGAALIERWGLPEAVARAAFHHHTEGHDDAGVQMIALADLLAHVVLDRLDPETVRAYWAIDPLMLYPEDVDALLSLSEEANRVAGAFL